jgi:hypothetical protein
VEDHNTAYYGAAAQGQYKYGDYPSLEGGGWQIAIPDDTKRSLNELTLLTCNKMNMSKVGFVYVSPH